MGSAGKTMSGSDADSDSHIDSGGAPGTDSPTGASRGSSGPGGSSDGGR